MSSVSELAWVDTIDGLLQPGDWPAELIQSGGQMSVESARRAAVLVPLFWHQQQWHLLFIRRCERAGDRHSGQVAFPGGRTDPTDANSIATALRETHEEIGLAPQHVSIMHALADYHTVSNYLVTPVVGVVPWPYSYRLQPSEVDRLFSIPLNWLCDQQNVQVRDRSYRPDDDPALRAMDIKVVYFDRYDGELLWGATARMVIAFLKSLHEGTTRLLAPVDSPAN